MASRSHAICRAALAAAVLAVAVGAGAAPAFAAKHDSSHGSSASSHSGPPAPGSKGGGKDDAKGSVTATVTVPGPGAKSGTLSVTGVVQSLTASAVSVRLLDGSAVSVPVDRNTKVYVDGKTARLADVKPGFVLVVSWKVGRAADTLRFVRPG